MFKGCGFDKWTGPIPDLGQLDALTTANFYECKTLTGDITGLANNCKELTHVDFFCCEKVTGSIAGLGACPNLVDANFMSCEALSGDIPAVLRCPKLERFEVYSHPTASTVPDFTQCPALKTLRIDYCKGLTGTIPDLSGNTHLKTLDLAHNSLTGAIPDLSAHTRLTNVDLSSNNLTGPLPEGRWWPPEIEKLAISHNPWLWGVVPKALIVACTKSIMFQGCRQRSQCSDDEKDREEFLSFPFLKGVTFASQSMWLLLLWKYKYGLTDANLMDPPEPGDSQFPMRQSKDPDWCSWQYVWLQGASRSHRAAMGVGGVV